MYRVCHISTLHSRYDVRIFHKECKSLAKHYSVYLIVADGLGSEVKDGVRIVDIGLRQSSRIKRAWIDSKKAFHKAIELDCDSYHIHDPELIKIATKLKKSGKKVIYDAHEDLPRQIEGKPYLKDWMKPLVASFVEWQENSAVKRFDYICTATPFIRERFYKINKNSLDINNFPLLDELKTEVNWTKKENKVCYIGGLSKVRGIKEILLALETLDSVQLNLAGAFTEADFEKEMRKLPSWKKVNFLGFINREKVAETLQQSKAGIVTLHPIKNYLDALPVKMFEYMIAGLPVIASDFPLWASIIRESECGLLVNPMDPQEIREAILFIENNPKEAERMGKNGRKSIEQKYNWSIEEEKLFKVYQQVLKA